MQNYCVGHVNFMLFVSISFAVGSQRKRIFQWNMGFRHSVFLAGENLPISGDTCGLHCCQQTGAYNDPSSLLG